MILASVKYQIEYSTDAGESWMPIVSDWSISRRGDEPPDFWSQSFCWGSAEINGTQAKTVRVRFRNNGGKRYARSEAHLVYRTFRADRTKVTFDWIEAAGLQHATHVFSSVGPGNDKPATWDIQTGKDVKTHWVEFEPVRTVIP